MTTPATRVREIIADWCGLLAPLVHDDDRLERLCEGGFDTDLDGGALAETLERAFALPKRTFALTGAETVADVIAALEQSLVADAA